jgi:hypothetical protein
MKISKFLLATLLLPQLLTPREHSKAAAWETLFNGKDLTGWKTYGAEKWVVENRSILGESAAGKYGYLTTEKSFRDFELRVRFKCESDENSGVFLRSRITGESATGPDIEGVQVEVDAKQHTGGLYESGGRGWLAKPTAEGERAIKPRGWNQLEITADGPRIRTRLNGVPIVDYTDPSPRFTEGVVGLQIHTGGGVKVRFKDISIRELRK